MPITVVIAEQPFTAHKCCLMWTRILLTACLTLILGLFSVFYTLQQDSLAHSHREQDQKNMEKIRRETIYDAYIGDISQYLFVESKARADIMKVHIRVKTLNILRHLEASQKRDIVLFLYEHQLIRSDLPERAVDLCDADLTDVRFTRPCNLDYLYLPGVLADKIVFDGCMLTRAVFNRTSMVGAKFIHTHASGAQFVAANLTNVIFLQTNNLNINFANAILVRSSFVDGPSPQKVNFTNADLFQSDLTQKQLSYVHHMDKNTLLNARLPDGSFSTIDSSQLINDGGAELSVSIFCDSH